MRTISGLIRAKQQLHIDRLVLQIHDASFPADPDEDCGRGSPYSRGAERFFAFAARLGFDAIQLGPQGMTPRGNNSPYDGTMFSRNPLSLPLARLVDQGRLSRSTLDVLRVREVAGTPQRPPDSRIFDNYQRATSEIAASADVQDRIAAREFLSENEGWLVPDALYGALCEEHNASWWGSWHQTSQGEFDQRLFNPLPADRSAAKRRLAELRWQYARRIDDYALIQWLLHQEHQSLRTRLKSLNLALLGDLQVGLSPQDTWARQSLFLRNYHMGAPPSRTNPEGQPWGYSVVDPDQLGTLDCPGPALQFLQMRLLKLVPSYDGLRIDHPHGWVDPWVYDSADSAPFHAVQHGARLYSSPNESDHPQLRAYAIVRPDQIDESEPRHGDHRVRTLDESQVARYSLLLDAVVSQARAGGWLCSTIPCEVLSTLPYPIQRVLERHGLGRFRVLQKAGLDDPADVYRIENARPEDWVMLGTHDTATIWELAGKWCQGSEGDRWGEYLAPILVAAPNRVAMAQQIASSPGELVHAMFTALLASHARHVAIFFPDLFGLTERYNQPGLVSDENWRLRLPADFEQQYAERSRNGSALDVVRCLERACIAREKPG